jgi:transcriptional regulator with XRE-family HTH domain
MARAGLGWTTRQLAEAAQIAPGTINRFEKNEIDSKSTVLTACGRRSRPPASSSSNEEFACGGRA